MPRPFREEPLATKQHSSKGTFPVQNVADEIWICFWSYNFHVTPGCVSLDDVMKTEAVLFHLLGHVVSGADPSIVSAFKVYARDKMLRNCTRQTIFSMVDRILQTTVTPEVLGLPHRVLFCTVDFAMRSLGKTDEHSVRTLVLDVAYLHCK